MEETAKKKFEVLVIDDESIVCKTLSRALSGPDFTVEAFENPTLALRRVDEKEFDIVLTDVVMGDIDGIQVLDHVVNKSPRTKVIIMTAFAYMNLARDAMARGAFDFIAKPFSAEEIRTVVNKAAKVLA
jgi:DNA-binding NtrC family response regulator